MIRMVMDQFYKFPLLLEACVQEKLVPKVPVLLCQKLYLSIRQLCDNNIPPSNRTHRQFHLHHKYHHYPPEISNPKNPEHRQFYQMDIGHHKLGRENHHPDKDHIEHP